MIKEPKRLSDELGQSKSASSPNLSLLDNYDILLEVQNKTMYLNTVTYQSQEKAYIPRAKLEWQSVV